MLDSICDEMEAQEIDPMPWRQKANCIWRTALHSAETGQRGYITEEAEAYLSTAEKESKE